MLQGSRFAGLVLVLGILASSCTSFQFSEKDFDSKAKTLPLQSMEGKSFNKISEILSSKDETELSKLPKYILTRIEAEFVSTNSELKTYSYDVTYFLEDEKKESIVFKESHAESVDGKGYHWTGSKFIDNYRVVNSYRVGFTENRQLKLKSTRGAYYVDCNLERTRLSGNSLFGSELYFPFFVFTQQETPEGNNLYFVDLAKEISGYFTIDGNTYIFQSVALAGTSSEINGYHNMLAMSVYLYGSFTDDFVSDFKVWKSSVNLSKTDRISDEGKKRFRSTVFVGKESVELFPDIEIKKVPFLMDIGS